MNVTTQQMSVAEVRVRQLPALLRPLIAAVRWQPSAGAATIAAVLLAVKADDLDEAGTALMVLRGVAAVLALGVAFLLDDAATGILTASPTSLAWRRSHRVAIVAAFVGVPWILAVLFVLSHGADLPVAGLTLELVTLLAVALAAAAGIARRGDVAEPGVLAAPLTVGIVLGTTRLPERWALLVGPGPSWEPAHQRWALLLAAAVLVFLHCIRDAARRGY